MKKKYEKYAYVLDFLPRGRPTSSPTGGSGHSSGPLAQLIGEDFFTLLQASVKAEVVLNPNDRVYVGKETRKKITYIVGRLGYDELTSAAKMELSTALNKIVCKREQEFVDFFNTSQAVAPRMHALELIPGIGKKYMWQIINERKKKTFQNFEDLQKRTEMPNPVKLITKRILEELTGRSKHQLFTRSS